MKSLVRGEKPQILFVALFTRAWIEIQILENEISRLAEVALFTRAWIEMGKDLSIIAVEEVALFTRAWIEILFPQYQQRPFSSRPLHEGVD